VECNEDVKEDNFQEECVPASDYCMKAGHMSFIDRWSSAVRCEMTGKRIFVSFAEAKVVTQFL
jgi:hypothetical protein